MLTSLELREHVVGKISSRIPAPDPQPKPGKFCGPKPLNHRLQTVVATRRSAGARAQTSEWQRDFVHDNQQLGSRHIVVASKRRDRLATEIHVGQGLGQQHRVRSVALGNERLRHLRWCLRPAERVAPRELFDHHEADVVSGLAVLAPRIAETHNELHGIPVGLKAHRYFLGFSSSFSSVLPFLMTSGSAAAAGAASAAAAVADSSAFGITMCTSIVSPSVTGFHFGSGARSRTRIDWCSSNSVTSTSMCSGMSVGRHCTWMSRVTKSSRPPCVFTPFESPLMRTGTVTAIALSIAS